MPDLQKKPDTGGDPGLTALMTTSHGEKFDPPKALKNALKELRTAQKKLSRQFEARKKLHASLVAEAKTEGKPVPSIKEVPYSNRLKNQIKVVAKLHTRVFNVRDYHHKKIASILNSKYNRVAIEEHGLQFMIRNRRLARSASDRAIGNQKLLIRSKLGNRYVATSNQRPGIGGNSQTCLCGESVQKELQDRIHQCPKCGLTADRDHVSANIVQLIAFGTISDTIKPLYGDPGRISSDVETSKDVPAKAVTPSRQALERSAKRHSHVSSSRRSTTGGKPTVAGKTGSHCQACSADIGACAEILRI